MAGEEEVTQVQNPRRATIRTVVVAVLALIPILPEMARSAGVENVPWVAAFLGVVAAVQRVLVLESVEKWLKTYIPWLAADYKAPKHRLRKETPENDYAPNRVARAAGEVGEFPDH